MKRPFRHRRSPLVRMLSPLRDFLATEASGAILIGIAAVAALIWANSPLRHSYDTLWSSHVSFTAGGRSLSLDLRHWINDGLMTIFFFVVGLEIKREMTDGHLASRRSAALPIIAALGGMLMPALIYLAVAGRSDPRGWAIPMATDIALAIGVLAVAGDQVPAQLRAFLLGLAIVDDIGAIIIIAAVYTTNTRWWWLVAAEAVIAVAYVVRRLEIISVAIYVVLGVVAWYCLLRAGIHPTLAGVAMGLIAPATPRIHPEFVDIQQLTDLSDVEAARSTTQIAKGSVSVVEWLQHALHPWTSYVIVPIFALANSGIAISGSGLNAALRSPITWGVLAGLVLGKPIGVLLAARLSVGSGLAEQPAESSSRQMLGIGTAAGIGFTVALFITDLAFDDPLKRSDAKLAILVASLLAAALSSLLLRTRRRLPEISAAG